MSSNNSIPRPSTIVDQFSLRGLLIAFIGASLLFICFAYLRNAYIRHQLNVEQEKSHILAVLEETSQKVESIRLTLGRAPKDTEELERVMGHPLKEVSGAPVLYYQTGANSYQLGYFIEWREGFDGDILVFDSRAPKAGWVEISD